MKPRLRDRLPTPLRAALGAAARGLFARVAGPLQPSVPPGSVIAICHCHDVELVPELAGGLLALPRGSALHVTSSDPAVFAAWTPYRGRSRASVTFHRCENRGRDLLPFFTVAGTLALAPDAAVLKLHGKRSHYSAAGAWWRRDTIWGLLPGPFAAHRARARFRRDPDLVLLGAPGSFVSNPVYWGRNRDRVASLMRTIVGAAPHEDDLGFIAGSMFWIRGRYLAELLPAIVPDAFEPEPLEQDGAHAHAVERVIGMVALARGLRVGETDAAAPLTPGEVRDRRVRYL